MTYFIHFLIGLIALQHFGFLILEMFFWTRPLGQKIFGINPEFAQQSAALASNQGLYNGFLAAGLIWSLWASDPQISFELKIFFLMCVFIAGLYGGWSVSPMIFYVQALPSLLTLALVFFYLKV